MIPVDLNRLREALRLRGCEHGLIGPHSILAETKGDVELWDMCDGCRPVTDAELAELGYVKAEVAYPNQGGAEMWISDRDGDRLITDLEYGTIDTVRPLVAGDLERMGLVALDGIECGEPSPEDRVRCHLPPTKGAHLAGHEARVKRFVNAGWATDGHEWWVLAAIDQEKTDAD